VIGPATKKTAIKIAMYYRYHSIISILIQSKKIKNNEDSSPLPIILLFFIVFTMVFQFNLSLTNTG
jgi:hypothetical protein